MQTHEVGSGKRYVRGTPVGASVAPADLAEAADVLAAAAKRGDAVAFLGGGTELEFGYPPTRVDLLVRTDRLTRVVDYAPADMIVEVEAGITLAALQRTLAPHRQRLALDVPLPERATLGGLVATNAFGPRRTRFGSLRDLIVGVSLIRADGTRVRGGGKVVKNVAGFDLPKISVGTLGTLGMIATATFRLHPLPERTVALRVSERSAADVAAIAREIVVRQLEPAAVLALRSGSAYDVHAVFEGFEAGVSEQGDRFAKLAGDFGGSAVLQDDAAAFSAVDEAVRTHGDFRMRFAVPPANFARLDREALAPVARHLEDAKVVAYPMLGIAFVGGFAAGTPAALEALTAARRAVEAGGGNAVVLSAADPAVDEGFDIFGTLPQSFALMRGLKDRFDPGHRFNPGRFLGRL